MGRRSGYGLIAAAALAPAVVLGGSCTWLEVLVAIGVAVAYLAILVLLNRKTDGMSLIQAIPLTWGKGSKVVGAVAWVANVVIMSYGAAMSMRAFPTEGAFPLYPLTLLALGTWVAAKGEETVARFGGVLCVFLVVPLLVVLGFGIAALEDMPVVTTFKGSAMVALLCLGLISGSGLWYRRAGKGTPWPWLLGIGLFVLGVSIVTMGDLGIHLGRNAITPFYEATKTISIFGVMERLEVMVAAVLLLGFGVLLAYVASIGGEIAKITLGKPSYLLQAILAGGLLWILPMLPPWYLLGMITISWVIIPVATLGVVARKKYRKICK